MNSFTKDFLGVEERGILPAGSGRVLRRRQR
jgi:hypothetical protein